MLAQIDRKEIRKRVHRRIRRRLLGTKARPRLAVFRSLKHIYAQVIDDEDGRTLATASTLDAALRPDNPKGGNIAAAKVVGRAIGERLRAAGIEAVVFDRGGFLYHGRVKALADAVRETGIKF
jgi:large subunit ribosomal protein L18